MAKQQAKTEPTVEDLLLMRIENLEEAFCKVATLTGNGNQLSEFGLKRWVPGKQDISKSRG